MKKTLLILSALAIILFGAYLMSNDIKNFWSKYSEHRKKQNALEQMYFYKKYCIEGEDEQAKYNCEEIKQIIDSISINL